MKWLYGQERCERARAWAGLAPDGELSELERRLLRAHTRRCPACAAYAVRIDAVVSLVRAQPLVEPPVTIARGSVGTPRRRRTRLRQHVERGVAVAAVTSMGVLAIALGTASHEDVPSGSGLRLIVAEEGNVPASEPDDLRRARRVHLLEETYPEPEVSFKSGVQPG